MLIFYLLVIIFFFISFSIFFSLNINFLVKRFKRLKELYFADSGHFLEQFIYFLSTEKRLYSLNAMFALIFGAFGFYIRLGLVGFILGIVMGWMFPAFLLQVYRRKRFQKINNQLIMATELIGSGMRAGQTLVQAIESSSKVLTFPIAQEIRIIVRQIRMGMSVERALEDFAVRIPLDDIKLISSSIAVSLRSGADLPLMLKKISDTIRERNSIRGKINTLTVQGKAEGFVAGLMPILLGIFMYWRDPDYMSPLFNTFIGHCILGFAVAMEIVAFFIIRKIVSIEI